MIANGRESCYHRWAMSNKPEFLNAAREAAFEAGKMLKQGLNEAREILFKGSVDLVTNFDRKAQEMIFDRLSGSFPDHGFLAEEGLLYQEQNDFRWVIDPLDGTTNYAHGVPVFCVSIGLEFKGKIILGVVYDPMQEEMFHAVRGEGAYLGESRIHVSSEGDLGRGLVATGFPYDVRVNPDNNAVHFNYFLTRVQAIRRCGSAALDLCYVACGRFDGFWELRLRPWDMAAGGLIVQEAGGRLSDFAGREFNIYRPEALATNGLIHEAMLQVIQLGKDHVENKNK
jgi:myo-inositol-1(or 4)-monophosphatase